MTFNFKHIAAASMFVAAGLAQAAPVTINVGGSWNGLTATGTATLTFSADLLGALDTGKIELSNYGNATSSIVKDADGFYVSASAAIAPIRESLLGAQLLLLDGTFWTETELVDAGLGHATARDMAHLPVGGPNGSVAQCADLGIERKLLTHINNTNPLLDPRSPERAWIESQGWALAEDGQRFAL